MSKNKLVFGVGVNDADYAVRSTLNKYGVACPYYDRWLSMIRRCYSKKVHARSPTYAECSVCDDWLIFSNFKAWMQSQRWEGLSLDKDILLPRNKVYCPDLCVFVDSITNSFIIDCAARRGEQPAGVSFYKKTGRFISRCCNPFSKKTEHLGYFSSPKEANAAWKKRKLELACQLSEMQTDPRVAKALMDRYL